MNAHTRTTNTVGPAEPDMEEIVVGAVLSSDSAYWRICNKLRAAHFSMHTLATIWKAIDDLAQDGRGFPSLMVKNRVGEQIGETQIGPYLATLIGKFEKAEAAPLVDDYVDTIVATYQRREMIRLSEEMRSLAVSGSEAPYSIIGATVDRLTEIGAADVSGSHTFGQLAERVIERVGRGYGGEETGLTTGLPSLDSLVGPLRPRDYIVLGGPSGGGKTALATQIAAHCAGPKPIAFFALDQDAEDIVERTLSSWSGLAAERLADGHIETDDYARLREAGTRAHSLNIQMISAPGRSLTARDIRARSLAMHRSTGLGAIIVDHLKLIAPPHPRMKIIEGIGPNVWEMKRLKDEIGCPLILLSQIVRSSHVREDPTPRMQDLWGGGDIEEAADVVMMCWLPAKNRTWLQKRRGEGDMDYDSRKRRFENRAEVILDKHRRRATPRKRWLTFIGPETRFEEEREIEQYDMLGD